MNKSNNLVSTIVTVLMMMTLLNISVYAGGLGTVTTAVTTAVTDFKAIAAVLVVLALIWVGFMVMFKSAGIADVWHVIIGALIIGAAATLGPLLIK